MSRIDIEKFDESGDIRTLADEVGAYDPQGHTRRDLVSRGVLGTAGFATGAAALGLLDPMEAFAAATGKQKGPFSISKGKVNRKAKKPTANDVVIANYALTLEYLEAAFYAGAAAMNYADPEIAAAATVLADHEAKHVELLKGVLKSAAVKQPKINMAKVGEYLATQEDFIKTAAMLEPVGTAAYAGAGPYLSNLAVTKAALSIHSVEANHAAYTQSIVVAKGLGTASPVPNVVNPAYDFNKTVKAVLGTGIVDKASDLQPN